MTSLLKNRIIATDESCIGYIDVGSGKPITVIGTKAIREGFDETCIQQAITSRTAPGVSNLILNADAHAGYGAPVGCVMSSESHVYPGPVGPDIKCSMSLLQTDLPVDAFQDKARRRQLINAVLERIPTGAGKGQRSVPKSRRIGKNLGDEIVIYGASPSVCKQLGIPRSWVSRCEDFSHGDSIGVLTGRLNKLLDLGVLTKLQAKYDQLGSLGSGNHFLSLDRVLTERNYSSICDSFGLRENCIGALSHCGSRGFGFALAKNQFRVLEEHFNTWNIPFPGGDRELVYAPRYDQMGQDYLNDMYLAGNFATVNHLLINALVLEAFQEVFPGVTGDLVYYISHNFIREEVIGNTATLVHRKGATRAYPAGHFSLKGSEFQDTGHPILLPGNVIDGSVIMTALPGSEKACYSVNHGAGRSMGRKNAKRTFNQVEINNVMNQSDIITNCRNYPIDESRGVYKDFFEVIRSVEQAELAVTVAKLLPMAVIKDNDDSNGGAA